MLAALLLAAATGLQPGMTRIAGGEFTPLYATPGQPAVRVAGFAIDTIPTTEAQFAAFAQRHTRFSFAGMGRSTTRAATRVSWEAAEAYCRARGARLPTTYEWEYVARADESNRDASRRSSFRKRVLELALRTGSNAAIGLGFRTVWGVRDLHGVVFEWTHDYNGHLGAHHGHSGSTMMCASGTVQTGDASDYAAFIRYSFRSTADADRGAGNVGFRCAGS